VFVHTRESNLAPDGSVALLWSSGRSGTVTVMAKLPSIGTLYPHFTEAQLSEVEDRLEQYLSLVMRIHERVRNDPVAYAEFHRLTAGADHPMMNRSRSTFGRDANARKPN
jgi:hypothetical protein